MSRRNDEAIFVDWLEAERFQATTPSGVEIPIDGQKQSGISPMQALAVALATCMGADVVDILRKGREDLTGCHIRVDGTRREEPPRRYTSIQLTFVLTGWSLSRSKAERAIQLSRDTYCSVWNSMATDIELQVDLRLREPQLAS